MHSMTIINNEAAGLRQRDLLLDHCVTELSNLVSNMPLWKCKLADKNNFDNETLKAALYLFTEIGSYHIKNMLQEMTTKKRKLVHIGRYFSALMLVLDYLMICPSSCH
jgi:hypothetical protein